MTLDPNYAHLNVIDIHAHFPIENTLGLEPSGVERHKLLVAYGQSRSARMQSEWSMAAPEPVAKTDEEVEVFAQRWADEVERYGLRSVNFVTGGGNDELAKIVAGQPDKFTGFAHHPLRPGACEILKHAVDDLGLKGYKLIGPLTEYPFEHPELRSTWEFCAERRLPVLIHFGWLGRGGGVVQHPRINPLSLFETARDFPEIPFVIPHFGVNHWGDVLALAWSLPNILVDTSGSNQWTKWMPYPLTLEDMFRKAYENLGPERILFGTDSSYFPRGFSVRYLQDQLRACYSLNFKEADIRAIFGNNAARLLGLESR
ncbi:hypothetical protein BH24DEI2_BH24DEI2_21580 [soil metagenome]